MGRKKASVEQPAAITPTEYGGLQTAFDHFNRTLFEGKLPDLFITYQRRASTGGYFAPDRFSDRGHGAGGKRHELALNPDIFVSKSDEFIASILVHEMTHHWQHAFGKPASRGYHNKQWGMKMKVIGLMPSNTGAVGGKETGSQMQHYIIDGGQFTRSFAALAATGWKLNLQSAAYAGGDRKPTSKVKYTCPECSANAWGKPDLEISCIPCGQRMDAEQSAETKSYEQQEAA